MKKILTSFLTFLLIFLSFQSFSQDDLESSLDESLDSLTQLGQDMDPSEKSSDSNNSASSVHPKETGLLDRMIQKIKEKFEKEIKSNPFRRMSGADVEKMLIERTEGTVFGKFLKESPRLMYFLVNFLRDEFALHDMFQIFKKEKELKTYSYFVIGNMIFFFLLGMYYDKKSRSGFIGTLLRKVFLGLVSMAICFAVFYVIFHKELKPTVGIAQDALTKAI